MANKERCSEPCAMEDGELGKVTPAYRLQRMQLQDKAMTPAEQLSLVLIIKQFLILKSTCTAIVKAA